VKCYARAEEGGGAEIEEESTDQKDKREDGEVVGLGSEKLMGKRDGGRWAREMTSCSSPIPHDHRRALVAWAAGATAKQPLWDN